MSTRTERKSAAAILGQKGGRVKSTAKARASRENGQKGGRPKSCGYGLPPCRKPRHHGEHVHCPFDCARS